LHELSGLDFVEEVDFQTEVFIIKGRAILKNNHFLQVYFNELTGTAAFALIKEDKRIWGIDFDNIRGWHLHPLVNPEGHYNINSMTIAEIIKALKEVWLLIS
jgi:hypothetical protein